MSTNSPIGFFDSGVGGLSVYSSFKNLISSEDTIYFGDLKNLPYGNKSKEELVSFARNILDFFQSKNVKAVVIACNTSSALAYEEVKSDYDFPIYPIIQSCAKIIANMDINKLGVFATSATVASGAYTREIAKYNSNILVKEIACPNWVPIVEGVGGTENDIKICMEEMLEFLPDKIVLGCTHYPYLLHRLEKYTDKEIFIDPAKIFAKYVVDDLNIVQSNKLGKEEFFVSANPTAFLKNAQMFYKIDTLPSVAENRILV